MWKTLWQTIKSPEALKNVATLKKRSIVGMFWLLVIISCIPAAIGGSRLLAQLKGDLRDMSERLPQFEIVDGQLSLPGFNLTTVNHKTQTSWLVVDPNITTADKQYLNDSDKPLLSIGVLQDGYIIKATNFTLAQETYAFQPQFSRDYLIALFQLILNESWQMYAVFIAMLLLYSAIPVLLTNMICVLTALFMFGLRRTIVAPRFLWRSSLFAAFLPVSFLAIINSFGILLPYQPGLIAFSVAFLHYMSFKHFIEAPKRKK